ncbi:SpoIIIAH-like family protein [Blautia sp.]|uniref:SpoIIIAH-like family protein n=1 Tax=Blautia sp. TaxID=1955243 RepID=UPI0026357A2A|nr:SpoIIIAH-like family protein [Blautia sp.]
MKKIFKKNQVIITALAIMIAVAGYINYSDSQFGTSKEKKTEDTKETASETQEIVEEIESLDYDITDETAMLEENQKAQEQEGETETEAETETPGEAVLTGSSNFAAQAKVNREQVRSANKETLLEIINNENLGEEQKQDAVNSMVNMTNLAEQEEAAELLLEAQGFSNIVVNLTGDSADVIVPKEYMEDARRAQIEDIVKRKTSVPAENIVITPLEGESEEKTSLSFRKM